MITNQQILNKSSNDKYCIYVNIKHESNSCIALEVKKNYRAPLINYTKNQNKFNILEIINGNYKNKFLLSGGLLVIDGNNNSLVIGQRNDKSIDPNCWTNIVAGRCDNYWPNHIKTELSEELLLIKKNSNNEAKLLLPNKIVNLNSTLKYHKKDFSHIKNFSFANSKIDKYGKIWKLYQKSFWKKIIIKWPHKIEKFYGIVFKNTKIHTIEIRQVLVLYSNLDNTKLIFPEGNGKAKWISLVEMHKLREKEKKEKLNYFVAFMRFLIDHL